MCEAAVAALWDVVYADGNRHAKEDLLVGEIAGLLGVDEATCERIRDEEVAARADELGVTLIMTGRRHFNH